MPRHYKKKNKSKSKMKIKPVPVRHHGMGHCGCSMRGGNIFDSIGSYIGDVVSNPARAALAVGTFGASEVGIGASKLTERLTGQKGSTVLKKAMPAIGVLAPQLVPAATLTASVGDLLGYGHPSMNGGKRRRKRKSKKSRR